jgi:hypothetical protein
MKTPRKAPKLKADLEGEAAVCAPLTPLTMLEIGQRMRDASKRHDGITALPPKQAAIQAELGWALDELRVWEKLALAQRPVSLTDAAVLLGVLFDFTARINDLDLESQLSTGALQASLATIERELAGLAVVVSAVAGVDLADVAEGGLPERLGRCVPPITGAQP